LSDGDQTPEALFELFHAWQRTHTQSSVTVLRDLRQSMDVRFCEGRNHRRQATRANCGFWQVRQCALLRSARQENPIFS
jgi:hypothetical protein